MFCVIRQDSALTFLSITVFNDTHLNIGPDLLVREELAGDHFYLTGGGHHAVYPGLTEGVELLVVTTHELRLPGQKSYVVLFVFTGKQLSVVFTQKQRIKHGFESLVP